jgi:hypothetical protein
MFGLVMIVFSFYYRDKQLNRFDDKQSYHIIDSLNERYVSLCGIKTIDSNEIVSAQKFIGSQINIRKPHAVIFTVGGWNKDENVDKSNPVIRNEIQSVLKDSVKLYKDSAMMVFNTLTKNIRNKDVNNLTHIRQKIESYQKKIAEDNFYFISLITVGLILFVLGTIFWYIKIQRPQDKLLLMQIEQIKKENIQNDIKYLEWKKSNSSSADK